MILGQVALTVLHFDPAQAKASSALFYGEAGSAMLALVAALAAAVRPWTLENFTFRSSTLLIGAFLGFLLTGAAYRSSGQTGPDRSVLAMVVSMAALQGAAIVLIWFFVRQQGWTLRSAFGLGNHPVQAALFGVFAAVCFVPLAWGLQFAIGWLSQRLGLHLPEQDATFIVRLADSWTDRLVLGVIAIFIAPAAEEALFRGIFYPGLKRLGHPHLALWGTSLLFGLVHHNLLSFFPLVILAVVLVKLYEKTQNLLACLACHAAFNALNFIMLFLVSGSGGGIPAHS
jgi:membrane protease YdiL (CAAX protease family)